jgi:translocation and assembly module TamB
MTRTKKIIAFSAGGLVLIAAAAGVLLLTETGQQFLIRQAIPYVPGLTVREAKGWVFDLTLSGVRYEMPGVLVNAESVHLGIDKSALWDKKLRITDVTLKDASADIETAKMTPSPEPEQPSAPITELKAPLPIALDKLTLENIRVSADGIKAELQSFTSSASWEGRLITLGKTALKHSSVTLPPSPKEPDPKPAQSEPLGKTLTAIFSKPLLSELPVISIPVDARIEGFSAEDFALRGGTPLEVQSLELAGSLIGNKVTIEKLAASLPQGSAEVSGTADLSGRWPLALKASGTLGIAPLEGEKIAADISGELLGKLSLAAQSSGALPAKVSAGTELATAGLPLSLEVASDGFVWPPAPKAGEAKTELKGIALTLTGSARSYQLNAGVTAHAEGVPAATAKLKGSGTLEGFELESLKVDAAEGSGLVSGRLGWADAITWDLKTDLKKLQLKPFVPSLPAVIGGTALVSGELKGTAWKAKADGVDLKAALGKETLSLKGSADAQSPLNANIPELVAKLGANSVRVTGTLSEKALDLKAGIDAPNLRNGFLPELFGSVKGNAHITGTAQSPALEADIEANRTGWGEAASVAHAALRGKASLSEMKHFAADLTLAANGVDASGMKIDKADVSFKGTDANHTLSVSAKGSPVSAGLTLQGALDMAKMHWAGTLSKAYADTPVGPFRQTSAAKADFTASPAAVTLSEHCWQNPNAEVCFTKPLHAGEIISAAVALRRLDTAMFKQFVPEGLKVAGRFSGNADMSWNTAKEKLPTLHAAFSGEGVRATKSGEGDRKPLTFDFSKLALTASTAGGKIEAGADAAVRGNGTVALRAEVNDPLGKRALSGSLGLSGFDLSMLSALMPTGEKTSGRVNGTVNFGGDLTAPQLNGEIRAEGLRLYEGLMPIDMKPSDVRVRFSGQKSELDGAIVTAGGRLDITGDADWHDPAAWLARVRAKGDSITVTVPSLASVTVSPDVTAEAAPDALSLAGEVNIPKATIEVEDLPPSAVSVSEDEVMLGDDLQPKEVKGPPMRIKSNLIIRIGKEVRVRAYGFRGRLEGLLKVIENGKGLGLSGTITIPAGRFHAYGQDLVVRKGEVQFTGPVSAPVLNIEAIRNPEAVEDDVVAGLRVTGTAKRPKAEIFSDPAMSQQAALSYLTTGHGLDEESDSSNAMTSALITMGLASTGGIVSSIGDAIGIRGLAVDTAGSGDSSQAQVSGYVLPGLQVKYGVGLFDPVSTLTIRYRLMPKLYVEAVSGVNQVINLIYKFEFD